MIFIRATLAALATAVLTSLTPTPTLALAAAHPACATGGNVAAAVAAAGAGAVEGAGGEPLPSDPRIITGELDNGLPYFIFKHAEPPGRAILRLHIDSGSLNETDQQRGIAHFLEHMAFNGSENFAPGEVVPFFQELGLSFGRHQNASTGFDRTFYMLELPDAKRETLDKGMLFLSDVAFGLLLLDDEIEKERPIILEEKRTRESAQQRVVEQVIQQLAPESLFGERLPIGTEETIRGMDADDFRAYYEKWYVPSNMAFIAVGDFEPEMVAELIEQRFEREGVRRTPQPEDQEIGVQESVGERAIIATDPELAHAEISISHIAPPRGPTTTVEQFRRDLVESLGERMFNRRVRAMINEGRLDALSASAGATDFAGALRWTQVSARGEPADWRAMLEQTAMELQRARLHGFREVELADATADAIAAAERGVQVESTMPSRVFVGRIHEAIVAGEPAMSAQQRHDLIVEILPTITVEEISRAFAAAFTFDSAIFILQGPSGVEFPGETELVRAGRAALEVTPEAEADRDRPDALLAELPEGGALDWGSRHAASDVTTIHLENGVVAHIRPMDVRKDSIGVRIRLMGGTIEETAGTNGLTSAAAAVAFARAKAAGGLSSTDIRDLMVGSTASVSGGAGVDVVTLSISSNRKDLEQGFQLAYLLLTDPTVEAPAFEQWKQTQKQILQQRRTQVELGAIRAYFDALYPKDDVRVRPFWEEAQIDAITLDRAQQWLDRVLAESPIEVSAVGDIEVEEIAELIIKYLGALPSRAKVTAETNLDRRTLPAPKLPVELTPEVATQTDKAMVIAGFLGADYTDHRDRRALSLAARIISTRMIERIREDEGLAYSISASSRPETTFPGLGAFLSQSYTDPEKADRLGEVIHEMFATFAAEGPTDEELTTAKRQLANTMEEDSRQPGWWLNAISDLAYLGVSLDEVMTELEGYEDFTADEVREVFARYNTPDRRFTIKSIPVGEESKSKK